MDPKTNTRLHWPNLWTVLFAVLLFGIGLGLVGTVILSIVGFPMILLAIELLTPTFE